MVEVVQVVKVGIADLNITADKRPIRTSGLGSCVGVVIYDITKRIAGLAHVMLPDSSISRQQNFNPYKYADTSIDLLIEKVMNSGARKFGLKAKIAGGAQMFSFTQGNTMMQIGARNITAVKQKLSSHHLPLVAEDVGGNCGRTIEFDPCSGLLKIRTVNKGITHI